MCRHSFKESKTHQIDLPEDDPEALSLVLKYLYAGDFASYGDLREDDNLNLDFFYWTRLLPDVFLLAEKYQISDLKELVVSKLPALFDVREDVPDFLEASRKIYTGIPETDTVYRPFFQKVASEMPKAYEMDEQAREAFDKAILGGGMLAVDLVAGMCSKQKELEDSQR
ncbi:MAG: hypothetical protein Q9183_007159 [Haloplaca sp. 2 TL-2023]